MTEQKWITSSDDETALHAVLDAEPQDWDTRLALADLLEEQGRSDEAALQRLIVEQGWDFWKNRLIPDDHNPWSYSADAWRYAEQPGDWDYDWHPTRQAAETAILEALKAARKL